MTDVTRILSQIESGDPSAAEQLLPLVYDELRKLAAEKMAQEKPGQTLQATALVHEAYIRLVDVEKAQHWDIACPLLCRCGRSHAADSRGAGARKSGPESEGSHQRVALSTWIRKCDEPPFRLAGPERGTRQSRSQGCSGATWSNCDFSRD